MKKTAPQPESPPADAVGFERFQAELARLVAQFEKNFKLYQSPAYSEASVRQDFLDPLFRALGWDVGNRLGLIPQHREVEIESRTEISGRQKRADYLFRTDRVDRFVCEAKKPSEILHAGHAFQAKRYAWNKNLVLAVLSDFEEIKIYLVGARPHADDPDTGHFQTWHYLEYIKYAPDIWNLLSRDAVAAGSIEKLVAALPRKPAGKTRQKQMWLFKPDRARAIDADFLDFLDEARRGLASDLIRHNDRADLLEGARLDEAVQRILDRLLFLRICEDRDIDTGRPLANILKSWRGRAENPPPRKLRPPALPLHEAAAEYAAAAKPAPPESLWRDIVDHFRALDRRPASHIPYFNGNLFKEHFSESLHVSDEWISGFLDEIGDDESPYLFNVIPVEILGTIYERYLGKIIQPTGLGTKLVEKPEVRKAGGVYYTPRYVVDYIVEQTLGKLIDGKAPAETLKLRVLDPACGSGSFLIRAFERLCEHWQTALTKNEKLRRKTDCWTDPVTGDLHLTTDLKRRILTAAIYGVDLDPGAVEVTQLSLYLKMLEGESRATLAQNRELFSPDAPLLPPLQDNIKCGNSLIASDFSLNPDDLLRVRAFDWDEGFRDIMKNGGFDVVIGNPPYVRPHNLSPEAKGYFWKHYDTFERKGDLYCCFIQKASQLCRDNGRFSFIVSNGWLRLDSFQKLRRLFLDHTAVETIVDLPDRVFADAQVKTCIFVCRKTAHKEIRESQAIQIQEQSESQGSFAPHFVRIIPQSIFHTTYKEIFDISISPESEIVKDRVKSRGIAVGELFDVCFGLKTGDDEMFLHHGIKSIEDKPLLRGDDISRYGYDFKGEQVWYVPDKMRRHRTTARPGEPWRFEQPKVLIKDTTTVFAGAYDDKNFYVKDVLIIVPRRGEASPKINLKAVLAILNSKLLTFFYRTTFQTIHVQRNELASLPLARIDTPSSLALHDKLVALVDKMLLLVPRLRSAKSETERATLQNAVSATDRAIDALVYELYGLTPEEIALVEKSQEKSNA